MKHYNNVAELRHAEDQTKRKTRYQADPQDHSSGMLSSIPADTSEDVYEDSSSDETANDENLHKNKRKNESNDDTALAKDRDTDFYESISTHPSRHILRRHDPSPSANHRESSLLLQLIPYKPLFFKPSMSDRLLANGVGSDGSEKHEAPGATNSIRLLLDKWTVSGSAPVAGMLEEESEKDRKEALVAET